jgi:hypothetical protein
MKLTDLSADARERIKRLRYDCILEKHEGPEKWADVLECDGPDFLDVQGHPVLLPVPAADHPNITVLRAIEGDQGRSLTLILKDTTRVPNPRQEAFFAGFLAVCDKMDGEEFFVAIVYHEWFLSAPLRASARREENEGGKKPSSLS